MIYVTICACSFIVAYSVLQSPKQYDFTLRCSSCTWYYQELMSCQRWWRSMKLSAITIQHHLRYDMHEYYILWISLCTGEFLIIRNAWGRLTSVGEEYTSLLPWVTASHLSVLLWCLWCTLMKCTRVGDGSLMYTASYGWAWDTIALDISYAQFRIRLQITRF